jgi:hypothetical protein
MSVASNSSPHVRKIWQRMASKHSQLRQTSSSPLELLDLPNELIFLTVKYAAVLAPGTLHAGFCVNRVLRCLTLTILKHALGPQYLKLRKTPRRRI